MHNTQAKRIQDEVVTRLVAHEDAVEIAARFGLEEPPASIVADIRSACERDGIAVSEAEVRAAISVAGFAPVVTRRWVS